MKLTWTPILALWLVSSVGCDRGSPTPPASTPDGSRPLPVTEASATVAPTTTRTDPRSELARLDWTLEQKPATVARQLEAYAHRAGAKVIYFVTNLSRDQANRVLQDARAAAKNLPKTTQVIPICGVAELLALLRTLNMSLEQALERRFARAMPPEAAQEDATPPSAPGAT